MLPASAMEGCNAHSAGFEGFFDGDLPGVVRLDNFGKPARHHRFRPSEMNAPRSGGSNSLGLAFLYVLPLALGHETEDLEYKVGDEGTHQVFAIPGVEQRHIDYADVDSDILGQHPPLPLNLLIVATQPVDTENVQQMGSLQADATITDSVSALLEGVQVTVDFNAVMKATARSEAQAHGYKGGGVSGFDAGYTDMAAKVGSSYDPQSAAIVVGEGASLTAPDILLNVNNEGSARSHMEEGKAYNITGMNKSKLPTDSWYSTIVSIGKGARLEATGGFMDISTGNGPIAESVVESKKVGILMNFNTMKGQNNLHQETNVDIGEGATLIAKKSINILPDQWTEATASTASNGGSGLLAGDTVKAENNITRVVRINIGKDASLDAGRDITLKATSGSGDNIVTRATVDSGGFVAVGKAKATANLTTASEIFIGEGAKIHAVQSIVIDALLKSRPGSQYDSGLQPAKINSKDSDPMVNFDDKGVIHYDQQKPGVKGYAPGIDTFAQVDDGGFVPIPKAIARTNLKSTNYISINSQTVEDENGNVIVVAQKPVTITSDLGTLDIDTTTATTTVRNQARAIGKGGIGVASATSTVNADLENAIWIDKSNLKSETGMRILSNNGVDDDRTHLIASSYAKLSALAGKVAPTTRVTGLQVNQIRTHWQTSVDFKNTTKRTEKVLQHYYDYSRGIIDEVRWVDEVVDDVTHTATSPSGMWMERKADYKRWQIKIFGVTITLTKANKKNELDWGMFDACNFCAVGDEYEVLPTEQEYDMEERYRQAYERAMAPINTIRDQAAALEVDQNAMMAASLSKGLVPLTYMNTLVKTPTVVINRARFSEEAMETMRNVFVTAVQSILANDVRLGMDRIEGYQMWNSSVTGNAVYLLPNATRIYMNGSLPQYISETLRGDMRGDGTDCGVELVTALSEYAYGNPILPIDRNGTLDFATGELLMPAHEDHELFLDEVSAKWLTDRLNERFIQTYVADSASAASATAINGGKLLEGEAKPGLIPGGDVEGWKLYWLGDTPETAQTPRQPLYFLLVNEASDEVNAFRTSAEMLNANAQAVSVSIYMFRDGKADMMEEERYNMMLFDTPEGERSMMKVVTDLLDGGELELPRPLRVVLRAYHLDGVALPVYCLDGSFLLLLDGTQGGVSLFNGTYQNTFDGTVFESDYVRIEPDGNGGVNVTVKKDQPIWPEWTGDDSAENIGGDRFIRVDGVWTMEAQPNIVPAPTPEGWRAV